ncbi:Os03g0719450 [Oryza sativa Japonica Group]|uniref:Os03g0719450 protein n=1 Tax=Oryza sativa subsp. japonica TaxID=39947 RepID=A0A0P0W2M7_ORYSJ|nr:hypothetical protein EE612_020090 [Oryza sativa]BAS86108.1 Os03g0719450 [Oryza sativa Japonica Group]
MIKDRVITIGRPGCSSCPRAPRTIRLRPMNGYQLSNPRAQPIHNVVHDLLLLGLDEQIMKQTVVQIEGLVRG